MAGNIPTAIPFTSAMLPNPFIPDMSKLDPFDGKNYKMWSDKMEFFLGQIGVDYCLTVIAALLIPLGILRKITKPVVGCCCTT